ncbi:DNA primase [Candidatus Gracilibacteria bacterium]|nr:DNA primase [Candidatus Gracilibacteria bacterium]OIO76283.1 MAG: DNA primase [Candidatus Gracilibacteria bacterium CG1_02_38_174]PIQ12294.1 MAG: DNA primase [Candidatus Gracilibacteria bacterium CG18_big_fil_WC_8_21_14_2_50_38_16]PIQ42210.1 MAG: DNA primase [Candidatus Gracilibacteria bacterium CG12_big_fil_rev_8_21_14_0_65_38_15]PIZ02122.1 MAG: DNA primase [Candidatus Gracilibacteria bacterium CG_4_10_14_0_8_um_filter_38_28]
MSISQEIESKINIVELAGRYVQMKKAGVNYKALCPFHSEKTASFVISPVKNLAYCFSCHHGGGPIRFLMEMEKIEFSEALHILAKEAGVELKTDYYKERGEKTGDIYDMYRIATDFYREEILRDENKEKLNYLLNRGISRETIDRFGLGYSGNPRELFTRMKDKGFTEQAIIDSGIFVGPGRDKFYGRIIFPIANFAGHTVAFTGRITDKGEPKYLNSPVSDIFNKSAILYGFHLAKSTIAKEQSVIIVEGQMDTVALHQANIYNTVGISGTALTKEHITLIKRFTKKLYLCLDGDKAGVEATFKSLENLYNEDLDIYVISLPDAKDPDEFIKSGGDFQEEMKKALTPIAFYIKEGAKKYDITQMTGKKAIWEELKKMLKHIKNPIEIDAYIREIGKILNLSTDVLYSELKNFREKRIIEDVKKQTSFERTELLGGYMRLYGYFDLFLEKFQYTLEDGMSIPSFFVIKNLLSERESGKNNGAIDLDRLSAIELFIEEDNASLSQEIITQKFLELIGYLNKICFEQEKKILLENIDPNSTEYMIERHKLQEKAKKIGVKFN